MCKININKDLESHIRPCNDIKQEINSLFVFLNKSEIEYCILQSEKEFYVNIKQCSYSDIDLYVSKDGLQKLTTYLKSDSWFSEDSYRFKGKRLFFSKYIKGFKLKLDVSNIYAIYLKNSYFEYSKVMQNATCSKGYIFLNNRTAYFFLLKKMAETKVYKISKINTLIALSQKLSDVPTIEFNNVKEQIKFINKNFSKMVKGRTSFLDFIRMYSKRVFFGSGKICVSFIGMDGSGKGTYIELVKKNLEENNLHVKLVYLGHSGYINPLIKIISKQKIKSTNGYIVLKLLRFLYLILFPLDLMLRRGRGIYDVMITDRHPNFEKVFPRSSLFRNYDDLLSAICPKPDIIFFLSGDKIELWNRKKEMSWEDYTNKSKLLDDFIKENYSNYNIIQIDTTESIDATYKKIWSKLSDFI
jgi:thymidylate kinase